MAELTKDKHLASSAFCLGYVRYAVKDAKGKEHKLPIYLNIGGEVINSLDRLRTK